MFRFSHARGLGKRWGEREKEGWRERERRFYLPFFVGRGKLESTSQGEFWRGN